MKKEYQIISPKDFNVTDNEYRIDGKTYYRVTATLGIIAKHRVTNWIKNVGKAKAEAILASRQAIGTLVHKLIERELKGETINLGSYEKEVQTDVISFRAFKFLSLLKPEALEQTLWSNKYGYAGTADYLGKYKSPPKLNRTQNVGLVSTCEPKFKKTSRVLGDWKTGKDIYPQYWLQLAAYAVALEELTEIKVDGAFIAQMRNGKLRIKEMTYDELMEQFEAYLHVLGLYEWQHKLGKWNKGVK